ncbi:hypothetical protein NKG94_40165 [Micromonospora sp. M12]
MEPSEPGWRVGSALVPPGRRAGWSGCGDESGPGWVAEPSQPYEPVRAESPRPYEPVRADLSRGYDPARAEPEAAPERPAELTGAPPADRPPGPRRRCPARRPSAACRRLRQVPDQWAAGVVVSCPTVGRRPPVLGRWPGVGRPAAG